MDQPEGDIPEYQFTCAKVDMLALRYACEPAEFVQASLGELSAKLLEGYQRYTDLPPDVADQIVTLFVKAVMLRKGELERELSATRQ